MTQFILLILSYVLLTTADPELNTNGPFGKAHQSGYELTFDACERRSHKSNSLSKQHRNPIQDIQVSKTLYVNGEPIELTWTSIFASCKDDFIGVFPDEVPIQQGN